MSSTTAEGAKKSGSGLAGLQRFGRSLMLPIATLPAAGILLRFGQAQRKRVRQHRNGIGAAKACGNVSHPRSLHESSRARVSGRDPT